MEKLLPLDVALPFGRYNTKLNLANAQHKDKQKGQDEGFSCGEAADLTGVYAYIGRNSGWQTFGIVCTEGQAVKPLSSYLPCICNVGSRVLEYSVGKPNSMCVVLQFTHSSAGD